VTTLVAAGWFVRARWGTGFADRGALLRHQERRIERFLRTTLPHAPFYAAWDASSLAALPIVDKAMVLASFDAFNTRGVTLDRALALGLAMDREGDFRAPSEADLTVGLSSGTSGTRGVFLVSDAERSRWAGVLLARVLNPSSVRRMLDPTQPPLRVALFLRANSNLYCTLASRRLDFRFHNLFQPLTEHVERLNECPPDVLAAPPSVLRLLAEAQVLGALAIAPSQVISVAEVLEPDDAAALREAFGVHVQQVYQATEGFLGVSCEANRVHLNEDLLHVEPEWLDAERRRFRPVITDFTRTTQLVVRFRLDDVLLAAADPCRCGRPSRSLDAIEGRTDDVLWAGAVPVFPDAIRGALARIAGLRDYRLVQDRHVWTVRVLGVANVQDTHAAVSRVLLGLVRDLDAEAPAIRAEPWQDDPIHDKRRRIRCAARPR
jgi:putative adenylate-forming enzyme